jgi:hypothetical protein
MGLLCSPSKLSRSLVVLAEVRRAALSPKDFRSVWLFSLPEFRTAVVMPTEFKERGW